MKIVRIFLDEEQRSKLNSLQKGSDYRSERALAVLHCADGKRLKWISEALHRSMNTIRSWVHGYIQHGIGGLDRDYSPGRPRDLRERLADRIKEYFQKSPADYGWGEEVWSEKVIAAQFKKETGHDLGEATVYRCLSEMGYSYKRAKKTVPQQAPTKEEKLERIKEIAREIIEMQTSEEVEVFYLDESHFSTEPYVTRGWHPKGVPFFPQDAQNEKINHNFWGIRYQQRYILLDEYTYRERS